MKKIVIVRLSAIGDIVNTTIVLQFIKKSYPDVSIDWVCEKSFSSILKNHPLINKVIEVDLKSLKKTKSIRGLIDQIKILKNQDNYDYIIDMQGLLKSAIVARLLGKNVYGFDKNSIREAIASKLYKHKTSIAYQENIIIRNITLINDALNLNIDSDQIKTKKPTLPSGKKPSFLSDSKNVILIIGASWSSKIYPIEKIIDVCNNIKLNFYVPYSNDEELEKARLLKKSCINVKILPKMSLVELSNTIAHCDLVIGNDTGPTHMAWAHNVASITIFGPTNERMIFKTSKNIAINSNSKVDIMAIDKNDFTIQDIDPKLIYTQAKQLLGV